MKLELNKTNLTKSIKDGYTCEECATLYGVHEATVRKAKKIFEIELPFACKKRGRKPIIKIDQHD